MLKLIELLYQNEKNDSLLPIIEVLSKLVTDYDFTKVALWLADDEEPNSLGLVHYKSDKSFENKTPLRLPKDIISPDSQNDHVYTRIIEDVNCPFSKHFSANYIQIAHVMFNGQLLGVIAIGSNEHPFKGDCNSSLLLKTLSEATFQVLLIGQLNRTISEKDVIVQTLDEVERVASVGSWDFDIKSQNLNWSKETYRIYGLPENIQLTSESAIKFFSPEAQSTISEAFDKALMSHQGYELELPFVDSHGNNKWVKTSSAMRVSHGEVTHVYGAIEDITYQKTLIDKQHETDSNTRVILNNLNDAIVTISTQGVILSANQVIKKVFGYSEQEVIGKDISILMPEPYSSKHQGYMSKYLETGKAGIIGVGRELPAMKKDGSNFPMELSISEVIQGKSKVFIGIVRDISERKKSEQHIKQLAYYDELTQAYNRYSFKQDLLKCLHLENNPLNDSSIFLVDIDKFSQINLIYSEKIADVLLQLFVQRIKDHLPPWGSIYRNNADSFFIILKNHDAFSHDDNKLQDFHTIAEKILKDISSGFIIEEQDVNITASIGILDIKSEDIIFEDVKPLLELATRNAKLKGGNQIAFAESQEMAYLKRHSELTLAMKNKNFLNELFLVVQPQFDTSGVMVGSEALVRWQSPFLGFVSPAEFIPLAEVNGKIIELGNWVIENVCILISQRRKFSDENSPISINISAKQIAQPNFTRDLLSSLDRYYIPYSAIILELTESMLVADFNLVRSKMQFLKEKGVHFSLDDFGTGYSSLSYIQSLPISELKIDKSFIDVISPINTSVPIVNSIIQMAKALNLKIVAEGVETQFQLDYLKEQGCEIIQGYLFSKPLDVKSWLEVV